MKKLSLNKPYLVLLLGVVAVSFSAVFIKTANAPSTIIAFYRMLISLIFIVPMGFYFSGNIFSTLHLKQCYLA